MNLQIICNKAAFLHPQSVNNVMNIIRKNISSGAVAAGKKSADCCGAVPAGPRVIVPGNCRKIEPPISRPECSFAVVIGGSDNGFGFNAAEQLLYHGAKRVILADSVMEAGEFACEKLCKAYGKDRAKFYYCDVKHSCQIEGIFTSSHCRAENISILFNDLDAIQSLPESRMNYCADAVKISNTQRLTLIGLDMLHRNCNNSIIVNCASILGFMGWPDAPEPVYCRSEPVLQTTEQIAKSFPTEETGVRLVGLCPANRALDSIGLPDIPDESCPRVSCGPDPRKDRGRVGRALLHVMARAENGSAWLVEPAYSLREDPRLVRFDGQGVAAEEVCPASIHSSRKSS